MPSPLGTDIVKVVKIGIQGPPGDAGNVRLANLADVDATNIQHGAMLIYDASVQKFRALTTIEQDQIINGGYF